MVILIKAVIFDIGGVTIKEPMSHVYKAAEKKFGVSWERIKKEDEKLDPLTETREVSSREYISRLSKALKISDTSLSLIHI